MCKHSLQAMAPLAFVKVNGKAVETYMSQTRDAASLYNLEVAADLA